MDSATQLSRSYDIGAKVARVYQKRMSIANEQFGERVQKAWHGALAEPGTQALSPQELATGWYRYSVDFAQRSLLFWDTLRQRGNQYLELVQQGQPPVLRFDYETVLDGRALERPVNYALVRIIPPQGVT